ncbi:MAG: Crp/Fnr family transcriptional regulator [Gemmatimonadota bacterium]
MALSRQQQHEELLSAARDFSFLKGADESALEELAALAVCHDYPKNNILFYRGEPAGPVLLVVKGRVKLILDNEEGREVVVRLLRPGGLFGLIAALDGGPQAATAVAVTKSRLARFEGDAFVGWMTRHQVTHETFLREFGQRVREAYHRIGEHALLGVKERLWSTLLEIAEREGEPDPGSEEIVFTRPTHQELAHRIGSSREVVTRLLKELLESDLLEAEGRVIRVSESALILHDELAD